MTFCLISSAGFNQSSIGFTWLAYAVPGSEECYFSTQCLTKKPVGRQTGRRVCLRTGFLVRHWVEKEHFWKEMLRGLLLFWIWYCHGPSTDALGQYCQICHTVFDNP